MVLLLAVALGRADDSLGFAHNLGDNCSVVGASVAAMKQ